MTRRLVVVRGRVIAWYIAGVVFGAWALAVLPVGRVSAHGTHTVALEEFGLGVPVTQVFTSISDGLRAVCVKLAISSPSDVRIEYRVSTLSSGHAIERYRASKTLANVVGDWPLTLDFLPIEHEAGALVSVELRASRVRPRDGSTQPRVALLASRDRPLRHSYLLVGDKEQWGSLQFDAEAEADTALGRFRFAATRRLPPSLRQGSLVAAILVLYSVLFIPAIAVWLPSAEPAAAPRLQMSSPDDANIRRRRASGIVVCSTVLSALATALWLAGTAHGRGNLIDDFYAADLETTWKLHEGFDILDVEIGTQTLRAIWALPISRIVWHVTPPPGARLRTAVALMPGAGMLSTDGAYFRITAAQAGRSTELFARVVDPQHTPADQRWTPVEIDLSPFAGRPLDLAFATEPSLPGRAPDPSYDFAIWGAPTIVAR